MTKDDISVPAAGCPVSYSGMSVFTFGSDGKLLSSIPYRQWITRTAGSTN